MDGSDNGWERSAAAWVRQQGERGDFGRANVLDPVMLELARGAGPRFVDIGCGEGRFVRMLRAEGFDAIGIDPTEGLIEAARQRDPAGQYHVAGAEALPLADASCDCAVFYLALCDIPDLDAALAEAVRVLRPGGRVLVANLSPINSAGEWKFDLLGRPSHYAIDNYMEERPIRQRWAGIDVLNWHRPFSAYFAAFLKAGLVLRSFFEPKVHASAPPKPKFDRMPNFVVMDWAKPA